MRAVLERLEEGHGVAIASEIEAALAPGEMDALRAAGIVRDTGAPDVVELSMSDLIRALRALYGAEGRGLVAYSELQPTPMAVGIQTDAEGARDVALVSGSRHGFAAITRRQGRTLALVLTGGHLTRHCRERHPGTARVAIEVLEETLVVRGGRLALREGPARAPSPPPVRASARPARPLFAGATSWSQVRIRVADLDTLRVDYGPHTRRVNPADLGMAHAASRQPTRLWDALIAFCDGDGIFRSRRFGNATATKKTISRLARELRSLFGIEQPPFEFRRGMGWHARFVARDRIEEERVRLSPGARAMVERAKG